MTGIKLEDFCAKDPISRTFRPALCAPLSIGAFTYATDGHVAVRVDRIPEATEFEGPEARIASIMAEGDQRTYAPLQLALPEQQFVPCAECEGSGVMHECGTCAGTGSLECDCPHCDGCQECHACRGSGRIVGQTGGATNEQHRCESCDGSGKTPVPMQVVWPCRSFAIDAAFLRAVLTLPGPIHMAEQPGKLDRENSRPQFFRGDGWLAAVMPMSVGLEAYVPLRLGPQGWRRG